jgi:hypothetical protein
MKTLLIKILVIVLTFSFTFIYSQDSNINTTSAGSKVSKIKKVRMTIRNAAKFTLEFNAMYDYGVYELSGNHNGDFDSDQFYHGSSFGVRHGVGGVLTAKIPMHKKGSLRANISAAYNDFSSRYNKSLTGVSEYDYMKYKVFSGIIGIENNFTPEYKIKTYIGIGLIGSYIMGNGRISHEGVTNEIRVIPAYRLGVSLNSGLEYMVTTKFGFNCGIRFTHANLWLKQSKVSDNPNEIYLNDKRPDSKIPYAGFKQFAWGSFFAGFNYYIGINEKEYIFKRNR